MAPRAEPDPSAGTPPAGLVETHTAMLLMLGDRVYKWKKPVDLGFLDFRDRAAREAACRQEVSLNRRLAPDVYLGVAEVRGPDGDVWEHLVVMRRLPDETRLSTLVTAGSDVRPHLRRLARQLADFHTRCARSRALDRYASAEGQQRLWRQNLDELEAVAAGVLDREVLRHCRARSRRYVAGRAALLDARIAAGLVCDGHGDLLADDIFCLPDGPRALDCLEFDQGLRAQDVLADVASLVMDLERLGAPDQAAAFLDAYVEFSGESHPASLADLYVAHRALVRAKVALLRRRQGQAGAGLAAAPLVALAVSHLDAARVRLVLVGGLPGTGKSTLATELATEQGWVLLRSDVVRQEVLPTAQGGTPTAGEDRYSADRVAAVYAELLRRAGVALAHGETVVLDASWHSAPQRRLAASLAVDRHADLVELQCRAPRDVALRRLWERDPRDASEATPAVHDRMAALCDAWPGATPVDTGGPRAAALGEARRAAGCAARQACGPPG